MQSEQPQTSFRSHLFKQTVFLEKTEMELFVLTSCFCHFRRGSPGECCAATLNLFYSLGKLDLMIYSTGGVVS